jgi:uncharacterized membrane protein YbhN (UPF0104 family)
MPYFKQLKGTDKLTFALLILGWFLSFSPNAISAQTLAEHLGYPLTRISLTTVAVNSDKRNSEFGVARRYLPAM